MAIRPIESLAAVRLFAPALLEATPSEQPASVYVDVDEEAERTLPREIDRVVVREQVRALLPERLRRDPERQQHVERLTDEVMNHIDAELRNPYLSNREALQNCRYMERMYRREGTVLRGAVPYQIVADTLSLQVDILLNRESAVSGEVGPLGREVMIRFYSERSSILERVAQAVREDRRLIPIFERLAENHPEIIEVCRIHPQFALDFLTRLEGIVREQGMDPELAASQLWSEFQEAMPRFEGLEAEERGRVERERTDRTERIAEIFRRALEIGRETGRRR